MPVKKPWLAVLLNCFPAIVGLGYLYIRMPDRFAVVFVAQIGLGTLSRLSPILREPLTESCTLGALPLLALWLFSIVDVYRQARKVNESKKFTDFAASWWAYEYHNFTQICRATGIPEDEIDARWQRHKERDGDLLARRLQEAWSRRH